MQRTHHRPKLAKRVTTMLLAASLTVGMLQPISAFAADDGGATTEQISTTQFNYPQERTFEQINQYYAAHPYSTSMADEYEIRPDIANPELNAEIGTDGTKLQWAANADRRNKLAGKLTDATLTNALNATNFLRYSAGLELVTIHTEDSVGGKQWRAQAGAAMLAELGQMTHNVSWADAEAAGISKGLYDWAKAGPSQSNGVQGSGVAGKVVDSFMPDIGNDHTGLSHRSYILNTTLVSTGFGAANISGKGSAVLMHVTWFGTDPYNTTAVMWPGEKQPIETFLARGTWQMAYPEDNPYQGNPWSFFINTADATVDNSKLKVTLECNGETEVLEYSKLTEAEKKANRLFTIKSFPLKYLVAFRPYNVYTSGDKVTVTIDGIVGKDGLPIPVTYDVHFFQTGTEPHPNLEQVKVARNQVSEASISYEADYAGTLYYVLKDADDTAPTADEVLAGTELELAAGKATLDLSALADSGAKKLYYVTTSNTIGSKSVTDATKSGEMSEVRSISIPAKTQTITPVVTAPTANTLTYNGAAQALVTAGSTTTGTLEYSLTSGTGFSTDIPAAINAGDYNVYYRVTGDTDVFDVAEQSIPVIIEKATVTVTAANRSIYVGETLPDLSAPVAGEHYTVSGLLGADALAGTVTLSYQKDGQPVTPDTTKAGTYDIVISGVTEPVGGNYNAIVLNTGTLTISARPSSSGSSSPTTYAIQSSTTTTNGAVSFSTRYASRGRTVTLTVKADEGYELTALSVQDRNGNSIPLTDLGNGKYSFVMPASKVTVDANFAAIQPEKPTISFDDVTEKDYFYEAVQWAVKNGITQGVGEKTFAPHAACTRAEMLTFLWRAAGSPEPKGTDRPFHDISSEAYYYKAILWALENGITNGIGVNEFAPDQIVSRAQTAAFLYRMDGGTGKGDHAFSDVSEDAYYAAAVAWAAEQGITGGVGGDLFAPDIDCTRGQIVTMLYRAANR